MDQKIKEIEDLERVKSNLLARMRVIENLQANRSATVHFFDEIVSTLPDGVNLTSLKESGGAVTIDGIADSNGRISTYMKNLDARSEEHTSELQSLMRISYAVFCLKKKKYL